MLVPRSTLDMPSVRGKGSVLKSVSDGVYAGAGVGSGVGVGFGMYTFCASRSCCWAIRCISRSKSRGSGTGGSGDFGKGAGCGNQTQGMLAVLGLFVHGGCPNAATVIRSTAAAIVTIKRFIVLAGSFVPVEQSSLCSRR